VQSWFYDNKAEGDGRSLMSDVGFGIKKPDAFASGPKNIKSDICHQTSYIC